MEGHPLEWHFTDVLQVAGHTIEEKVTDHL